MEYDYRGRHLRLLPQRPDSWAVLDERAYLGLVERTYVRIGDEGPWYAAKLAGQEDSVMEGWTHDLSLAIEWLVDENQAAPPQTGHTISVGLRRRR